MDDCCQFTDGCPIFAYFSGAATRISLAMYCQGDYGRCKRRQLEMAGEAVPADLLPQGGSLSDGAQRPRTIL
jgi:hypothetical protein